MVSLRSLFINDKYKPKNTTYEGRRASQKKAWSDALKKMIVMKGNEHHKKKLGVML